MTYTYWDAPRNTPLWAVAYYKEYLNMHNIVVDQITCKKVPAICYVDDRALCFDGHPETLAQKIVEFKPWNRK